MNTLSINLIAVSRRMTSWLAVAAGAGAARLGLPESVAQAFAAKPTLAGQPVGRHERKHQEVCLGKLNQYQQAWHMYRMHPGFTPQVAGGIR
ncbi:hypothetical protein QWZ03_17350 [Chitinimonas viridis]|uniref:Uncharacterized protein n=1 Tax=Chitinimonas viridis TaxID=664880 RepID=A0ABT8B922_9NEIS|nr:hypothetical protein [Chitinimonas viridis]MDN3578539.1 hypothetical protein [Chitinimonas viridis]